MNQSNAQAGDVSLGFRRVIELADAAHRIHPNGYLECGQDEAPGEAIDYIREIDAPIWVHPVCIHRRIVMNISDTPQQYSWRHDGTTNDIVLAPGHVRMIYRTWFDGVITPDRTVGLLSDSATVIRLLEAELESYGYQHTPRDWDRE